MLEIGSIVGGKYKVLNIVGQGGMSTVYLAMNERANKQWAIKEVRKDSVTNYQMVRQSLITETDLLKQLSHPYLPSIVDVIDEDGRFLIVMDYIEGNTLEKALDYMGAQPQEYVIDWGIQLCDVLEYLHTRTPAIIYRDLKPGNIMLRPDGTIALIDFGTAREYKTTGSTDTSYLGTRGYAAPEQFGGMGQTDARTDIYTLGATLYHLVTGKNPNEPPYQFYPIRYWNPQLSPGLEQIIEKCVQKNPDDRYNSCAEVMYDLQNYKELDRGFKRGARIGVAVFSFVVAAAVAFGSLGIYFKTQAVSKSNEFYDECIANSVIAQTQKDSFELIAEAIQTQPDNSQAYETMIDQLVLEDDILSPSEDEYIRSIFISSYGNTTVEKKLASNPKLYAQVSYKLGMAYFFCYDESGNKNMAGKWLKVAAESDKLSDKQVARAQILYKISQYYSKIDKQTIINDEEVTSKTYWDDLVAISDGNLAEQDNPTMALIIYKEMAGLVYDKSSKLLDNGASKEEIDNVLNNLLAHISADIESRSDLSDNTKKMVSDTKTLFAKAKDALDTASQQH